MNTLTGEGNLCRRYFLYKLTPFSHLSHICGPVFTIIFQYCLCSVMSAVSSYLVISSRLLSSIHLSLGRPPSSPPRCNGLRVYAVCGCNKVRLPGTGQSAHVIGGSRFTRPASNLTEFRLLATVQQNTNFRSHFESLTVYKSTNFDYLRTSFKANVKLVVRKRNV